MKINLFDVVRLQNGDKATILNISNYFFYPKIYKKNTIYDIIPVEQIFYQKTKVKIENEYILRR